MTRELAAFQAQLSGRLQCGAFIKFALHSLITPSWAWAVFGLALTLWNLLQLEPTQ